MNLLLLIKYKLNKFRKYLLTWLTVTEYLWHSQIITYAYVTEYLWHSQIISYTYVLFVVITISSLTHWWLIYFICFVIRVRRRVALVQQKLQAHTEHMSSPIFWGVCVALFFSVFCVVFCRSLLTSPFVCFLLAIVVLSVLLWFMTSDYSISKFNLFLWRHLY